MLILANPIHFSFNPNEIASDGEPTGADAGTEPGTTPSTEPMPTYLTPDALLFYCQSRLQGLDSQIQQGMQSQQNANYDQQDLQPVQSLLTQYADGCNDPKALVTALNTAIANIQGRDAGSPALPGLQQMLSAIQTGNTDPATQAALQLAHQMGTTVNPPASLNGDQMKGLSTMLTQITSAENSGAEINMINLQSLMSQRQTAVELTTNMMQTVNDTLNKVVSNVGH